jgi:hypothetical protein
MRRALALAALLLATPSFAGVAFINSMKPAGTVTGGYQVELDIVCLGATGTAKSVLVMASVLTGDTKAQINSKAATAIIAACAAVGVTVTGADITPTS